MFDREEQAILRLIRDPQHIEMLRGRLHEEMRRQNAAGFLDGLSETERIALVQHIQTTSSTLDELTLIEPFSVYISPEQFLELSPVAQHAQLNGMTDYEQRVLGEELNYANLSLEHLVNLDPFLRERLQVKLPDEVLTAFAHTLHLEKTDVVGAIFTRIFSPSEQEYIKDILRKPENILLLAKIDPDLRAEWGLSDDEAELWQQVEAYVTGMDREDQLGLAYQALSGWDAEAERAQLEALAETFAQLPTTLLGFPIPHLKGAYDNYLAAMWRRHSALLRLKTATHLEEGKGEDRARVLEMLQTLHGIHAPTWDTMLLPDLVEALRRASEMEARGTLALNIPDDSTMRADVYFFLREYDQKLLYQQPSFQFARDLALLTGSILYEPLDWILSGAEIGKDVHGSLSGHGDERIGAGTGLAAMSFLTPGSLSALGRVWRGVRRLLGWGDEAQQLRAVFVNNLPFPLNYEWLESYLTSRYGFTPQQIKDFVKPFDEWTTEAFADIRDVQHQYDMLLRQYPEDIPEEILSRAFSRRDLDYLETGQIISGQMRMLPTYQGEIYRAIRIENLPLNTSTYQILSQLDGVRSVGNGMFFSDPAIMSFTHSNRVAGSDFLGDTYNNVILIVRDNQSGVSIGFTEVGNLQDEVLVPSGTRYRIINVAPVDESHWLYVPGTTERRYLIELEEIPH